MFVVGDVAELVAEAVGGCGSRCRSMALRATALGDGCALVCPLNCGFALLRSKKIATRCDFLMIQSRLAYKTCKNRSLLRFCLVVTDIIVYFAVKSQYVG